METSYPKEKVKILLLEGPHKSAIEKFNTAGYHSVDYRKSALSEEELCEVVANVHIIGIRSKTQLTEKVLNAANKLRAVACFCIGTNQVDLEAARKLGIAVFNSPYSNTRSVAELAIAECVMLFRRIPERSAKAHQGVWLKDAIGSHELRGKRLGIVGYGHIGSQLSVLAEALGMKVSYFDVEPKLPLGNANFYPSLKELMQNSDILSLHVPANESTENMINASNISDLPKGSILINLSRGSVVEIETLKDAIESGHIVGAGIDVFPKEPKSKNESFQSPLQGLANVILTPHIGGSTQEAQENIALDAAAKLIRFLDAGSSVGSHSIPALNLPKQMDTHRVLHIHQNKSGVLSAINSVLSASKVNILGQYLKTDPEIGYVVLDIEKINSTALINDLKAVPHTIRARILY